MRIVVGRAVAEGRAAGRDQLADEAVDRLVLAERRRQPVVHRPHALLAERGAVGADQVGPFESPVGGVGVVVDVLGRVAGQAEQAVDQPVALVGVGGVEEGRGLLERRQRAGDVEEGAAQEGGVVAQRRRA